MSSKPNRNSEADATQAATRQVPAGSPAPDEEIRRRAYEIYLERGEQPGTALEYWVRAERELEHGAMSHAQAG